MSVRRTIVAAALAGLLLTGSTGCVCKAEYDKAVAAARRANEQLLTCQSGLQACRGDNQKLRDQLASRDASLRVKDDLLAQLRSGSTDLDQALKELHAKYQKLLDARAPGPIGPLPQKVDLALRNLAKQNPDLMEYMPQYGMLKLKSDLTFDLGSAVVKPAADDALKQLAGIVNAPEAKDFHIYAAGHTDNVPLRKPETIAKHGSNWGLSLHRAGAVVKVLATAGVEQRRLGAMGFSKYHPIAANDPKKGNAANRRVEIWIVPADRLLTVVSAVKPEK